MFSEGALNEPINPEYRWPDKIPASMKGFDPEAVKLALTTPADKLDEVLNEIVKSRT